MNVYCDVSAVSSARQSTIHGFILVPEDKWVPPVYVETPTGPWGWQWREGVRGLVSTPPSPIRITIKALMDNIEKVGTLERARVPLIIDKEFRMHLGHTEPSQIWPTQDPPNALSLSKNC